MVFPLFEKNDEYKNRRMEYDFCNDKAYSIPKASRTKFYVPHGSRNVNRLRKRRSDFQLSLKYLQVKYLNSQCI